MSLTDSSRTPDAVLAPEVVRAAIARLQDLPAAAQVVLRALQELEQPDTSTEKLQAILTGDPGATADLLRLANSAFFGVSYEVRTLLIAINVVGYHRLRTLLRHLLAHKLLERMSVTGNLAVRVRYTALAAAVSARALGQEIRRRDADELLVAGMLHKTGELALLSEFPAECERLAQLGGGRIPPQDLLETFGVDASTVSRWLLEAWHFPPRYVEAAARSLAARDQDPPEKYRTFVAVVCIAAHLAAAWSDRLDVEAALERVSELALCELPDGEETLKRVYEEIPAGVEHLLRAL